MTTDIIARATHRAIGHYMRAIDNESKLKDRKYYIDTDVITQLRRYLYCAYDELPEEDRKRLNYYATIEEQNKCQ